MLVSGRSTGALPEACEGGTNTVPSHGTKNLPTTPIPYSVDLSGFPNLCYIPGQDHRSKYYSV